MTGPATARPLDGAAASFPISRMIAGVPLPAALLLITMLVPGELDFAIGSLRLNVQRVVLLAFLPSAISRVFFSGKIQVRSFDFLFLGAFLFYGFAAFLKEDFERALVVTGIQFLESGGAYLIARAYIRTTDDFMAVCKLLFVLVVILGMVAIPESVFSQNYTRNFAAALTGNPLWPTGEHRMGLMRAMVSFDHPIHYGTFCAGVFGLVWYTTPRMTERLFRSAVVALATFFALSAGALQGIGVVVVGILWERTTREIPHRAFVTIAMGAAAYVALALVTQRSPLKIIVTSLIFDSGSAWYRMLIWDYGIDNVLSSPWLGVKLYSWDRPEWMPAETLDSFWLALAVWGGLPTVVMLILAMILIVVAVSNSGHPHERADHRAARFAWTAAVLSLCMVGVTVHYWRQLLITYSFFVAMGAFLCERRLFTAAGEAMSPVRRAFRGVRRAPADAARAQAKSAPAGPIAGKPVLKRAKTAEEGEPPGILARGGAGRTGTRRSLRRPQ